MKICADLKMWVKYGEEEGGAVLKINFPRERNASRAYRTTFHHTLTLSEIKCPLPLSAVQQ